MTEEQKQINVADMLRLTGSNTAEFMKQVAEHVEKLQQHIIKLEARILELEGTPNDSESQ